MQSDPPLSAKPKKLGFLRFRNTQRALDDSRKYSRIVDTLRWALPVAVLVALGVLFLWPSWQENRISIGTVQNVPNLMIEELNLTGVDSKNQPYSLTADRALQALNTKNLVDLERPKGEMTLTDGGWMALQAQMGRVDQETRRLWLGGNVEIFYDKGYHFTAEEMNVDMKKNLAWGNKPVVLQGDFGTIAGTGFQFLEAGKTIVFKGPAQAQLKMTPLGSKDKENINHSSAR